MIVFRVFSTPNSGLGHIVRCQYLAQALQQKGRQVYFIGDVIADQVTSFLNEVPFAQLYPRTPEQWDAKRDAQATLALIEKEHLHPDWVVVDHYYLGAAWETQLIQSGFRVMAIDDLVRPHQSQALLDFKWRGSDPEWVYANKVSPNTQLLLGSQYSLISPQLTAQSRLQHPQSSSTEAYTVLLSLGGGGDALILQQLLAALITEFKQDSASSAFQTIHFQVVIGPLLKNKESLTAQFSNQEWSGCQLTFIEGKTNLDAELTKCDLYLGLAGGLVYGLRAVKKPAITFSLSDNQNTDQPLLDAIGHYFHLNQIHVQDFAKLARWVRVCQQNPQRIQKLFAFSNVLIDTLGASRVADYMISGILSSLPPITSKNHDWTELA
ncbi:MAG: hypothetical protein GW929_07250, partial [Thiomicrospira sp.]|nr:hypothetical protein [Thiomicrospira sp.]